MKRVVMPDITVLHKRQHILIEGGWLANYAEVEADPTTHNVYVAFFLDDANGDPRVAAHMAREAIQSMYDVGMSKQLASHIRYWASKYADHYPHLVKTTGEGWVHLQGFDASVMQGAYVPGQHPGRAGFPYAHGMLKRMGEACSAARG